MSRNENTILYLLELYVEYPLRYLYYFRLFIVVLIILWWRLSYTAILGCICVFVMLQREV